MHHFHDCVRVIYLIQTAVTFIPASRLVVYFVRLRHRSHVTCYIQTVITKIMTGPRRFNSLVVAGCLVKISYSATFALLPPTARPCTVLLQFTLPLHSPTVRPWHFLQYMLPPTCSTVVTPLMLLTALYCPATVHAAYVYFGPVLSTIHAACLRHPVPQSSDSYPRLQTVTLHSLACLGTKTLIMASVMAFSHNLGLGAKLAQDGSPCHAPISKYLLHTF